MTNIRFQCVSTLTVVFVNGHTLPLLVKTSAQQASSHCAECLAACRNNGDTRFRISHHSEAYPERPPGVFAFFVVISANRRHCLGHGTVLSSQRCWCCPRQITICRKASRLHQERNLVFVCQIVIHRICGREHHRESVRAPHPTPCRWTECKQMRRAHSPRHSNWLCRSSAVP